MRDEVLEELLLFGINLRQKFFRKCVSAMVLSGTPHPCSVSFTVVVQSLSHAQFFATPWTVAGQAPLSMGFPRQEYWSGLPFPSPGDLSDPGIEPVSPALAGGFFTAEPPGKPTESVELMQIKWGRVSGIESLLFKGAN